MNSRKKLAFLLLKEAAQSDIIARQCASQFSVKSPISAGFDIYILFPSDTGDLTVKRLAAIRDIKKLFERKIYS